MESSGSRFFKTLILAAVIVGGIWVLMNKDRMREPGEVVVGVGNKLKATQIGSGSPQSAFANSPGPSQSSQPKYNSSPAPIHTNRVPASQVKTVSQARRPQYVSHVIRIASFKLKPKFRGNPMLTLDLIADICRRYDAIAFQGVDGHDPTWFRNLTSRMNQIATTGKTIVGQPTTTNVANYSFISDIGRNANSETQSAIVFNQSTLELDRSQWYTVADPDNVLTREPIVGWFRVRGPNPDQAFTFSLVNVKLDSHRPEMELGRIGDLYRAIRNDGRQEDDVLIVGDFNSADNGLEPIRKRNGLTWVVSNRSTTTNGDSQDDNVVFNDVATVEFTGRGGVLDFMRHYNLRLNDALSVSEHMPVWAEFSIYEGSR